MSRCPNGSRRNKQGDCVKKAQSVQKSSATKTQKSPTVKRKRCPNGTRRNKSGECVKKHSSYRSTGTVRAKNPSYIN